MKKLIILVVALIIASNSLFGAASLIKNTKDSQALLFTLNGLSELSSSGYSGGIGYQYYIVDDFAVRLGLGLNSENKKEFDPKNDSSSVPKELGLFAISFNPGIKYNFMSSSTIMGFVGAELSYSYKSYTNKHNDFKIDSPEFEEKTSIFGTGLFLGVEWFAWENVSIGAEYKLMFTTESGTQTTKTNNSEDIINLPELTSFGTGTSRYNFTISFYLR